MSGAVGSHSPYKRKPSEPIVVSSNQHTTGAVDST